MPFLLPLHSLFLFLICSVRLLRFLGRWASGIELGNVVGVVSARLNDAAAYQTSGALPQNVNYAVKSSLVQELLKGIPEL